MACDCCANNAFGIVVCNGDGTCSVLTPPANGGPWFPIRDPATGTWTWYNLSDITDTPIKGLSRTSPKTKAKAKAKAKTKKP